MSFPTIIGPAAKPSARATGRAPGRVFTPKLEKPLHCAGCVLETQGVGYVPAFQPETYRPILLLAESPAVDEQIQGSPLVGAAGSMLTRVLKMIGRAREDYRIDNLARCTPKDGVNLKAYPDALPRCGYWAREIAPAPPQVIVTMGALPTRHVLGIAERTKNTGVEELHGTVHRSAQFPGSYIVPTFHPSHLQRGATNLMGVVASDLLVAEGIVKDGWAPDPAVWIVDPPVDWFRAWVAQTIAARAQDPYAYPLAVDIETPDKGQDEGAIVNAAEDRSYQILRVNVSVHPDEGVTVPYEGPYLALLAELLQQEGVRYFWFKGFDEPRLLAAQQLLHTYEARRWNWDCMWMAKAVQSDLPQGLGFWAPFYSRFGAWKHLADTEPGKYAAIDGFQTRRVGDGLVTDLHATGMWPIFERHMHRFHQIVLQPATDLGVPVDRARLVTFRENLDREAARLLAAIQEAVPAELKPLTPKLGLTRPPGPDDLHTEGRATTKKGVAKKKAPDPIKMALYAQATVVEKLVIREVNQCTVCQALEVAKTHNCVKKGETRPLITRVTATVRRWFWHEPFNPDSPVQMMAYVKAKGHQPGKSKQTGKDAVDRETLSKLWRESGDPFYSANLDYRAVGKVRGTYAIGTERRLDAEDRLHGIFGFKPSTMRLNGAAPNLQNVVADKAGKKSLAHGFRACVVARGRWVEAGSGWEDLDAQ